MYLKSFLLQVIVQQVQISLKPSRLGVVKTFYTGFSFWILSPLLHITGLFKR